MLWLLFELPQMVTSSVVYAVQQRLSEKQIKEKG